MNHDETKTVSTITHQCHQYLVIKHKLNLPNLTNNTIVVGIVPVRPLRRRSSVSVESKVSILFMNHHEMKTVSKITSQFRQYHVIKHKLNLPKFTNDPIVVGIVPVRRLVERSRLSVESKMLEKTTFCF